MRAMWMTAVVCVISALWAGSARAEGSDLVAQGPVVVPPGQTVGDVVSFGGPVRIYGRVTGDVSALGGGVTVMRGGRVDGDVAALGGPLEVQPGGVVSGRRAISGTSDVSASGGGRPDHLFEAGEVIRSAEEEGVASFFRGLERFVRKVKHLAALYVTVVLVGLLLLGLAPKRTRALAASVAAHPLKSLGLGLVVMISGAVLVALLAASVVGIPVAALLVVVLGLGIVVGLAGVSVLLGELVPAPSLRERTVMKLLVGTAILVGVISLPYVGGLAGLLFVILGLGSLTFTRFRTGDGLFASYEL